jgi:hypothetical protein
VIVNISKNVCFILYDSEGFSESNVNQSKNVIGFIGLNFIANKVHENNDALLSNIQIKTLETIHQHS